MQKIKEVAKKARMKALVFKSAVKSQIGISVAAAFAFVIALSWNEFIKESVNKLISVLGLTAETWLFRLATALIVTIICVIAIMYFSRWGQRENK